MSALKQNLVPILLAVLIVAVLAAAAIARPVSSTPVHTVTPSAPPCSIDGNFKNDAPNCVVPGSGENPENY